MLNGEAEQPLSQPAGMDSSPQEDQPPIDSTHPLEHVAMTVLDRQHHYRRTTGYSLVLHMPQPYADTRWSEPYEWSPRELWFAGQYLIKQSQERLTVPAAYFYHAAKLVWHEQNEKAPNARDARFLVQNAWSSITKRVDAHEIHIPQIGRISPRQVIGHALFRYVVYGIQLQRLNIRPEAFAKAAPQEFAYFLNYVQPEAEEKICSIRTTLGIQDNSTAHDGFESFFVS